MLMRWGVVSWTELTALGGISEQAGRQMAWQRCWWWRWTARSGMFLLSSLRSKRPSMGLWCRPRTDIPRTRQAKNKSVRNWTEEYRPFTRSCLTTYSHVEEASYNSEVSLNRLFGAVVCVVRIAHREHRDDFGGCAQGCSTWHCRRRCHHLVFRRRHCFALLCSCLLTLRDSRFLLYKQMECYG